jgi:hypothetical protein
MGSSIETSRRAYTGSCHCGAIQYICQITLPSNPDYRIDIQNPVSRKEVSSIYKCNCTPCHKMGIFHIRLPNAPDDFVLLQPHIDSQEADDILGNYKCNTGFLNWYFCKKCGVRCFTERGPGDVVDLDLDAWQGKDVEEGEERKLSRVWRPKKDAWFEGMQDQVPREQRTYLSINAHTLDQAVAGQGPDLREWMERKWLTYLDCLDKIGSMSTDRPFRGGTY